MAALFALHPLHVESVAWTSERKDVLSQTFAFAATLGAWPRCARGGRGRPLPGGPAAARGRDHGQADAGHAAAALAAPRTGPVGAGTQRRDGPQARRGGMHLWRSCRCWRSRRLYRADAGRADAARRAHSPHWRVWRCGRGLRALPRQAVWPHPLTAFYPLPRWRAACPCCPAGPARRRAGGHQRRCLAAGGAGPALRGLAVVSGRAGAGDRRRPGRRAGDGRPLRLPALHRALHRPGLGDRGTRRRGGRRWREPARVLAVLALGACLLGARARLASGGTA